jgi:hypothetical protein
MLIWQVIWTTFGLGRLFRFLSGYDVTVGVWIRTRRDRVKEVADRTSLDWKAVSLALNTKLRATGTKVGSILGTQHNLSALEGL